MAEQDKAFEIEKTLFDLIKKQKIDEIITIMNKNAHELDLNIRDNSNTYFIQYAIMFNNISLIKNILKYNCKLDFIDVEGHTILYTPIKHGYNEIIKILLENNDIIGMSLVDIVDRMGSYAIHYALSYDNVEAFDLLLKYSKNINKIDMRGNTGLHIAIKKKNYYAIKKMLELPNTNLNIQTNIGESPLHVAANYEDVEAMILLLKRTDISVDLIDYEHQITPLMYSSVLNNIQMVTMLLNAGANPEIQDSLGNSSLHLAIIEDNITVANLLISKFNNLNLTNIEGMTPLHKLLLQYATSKETTPGKLDIMNVSDRINQYNFDHLFNMTNINIQDIHGNTIWHIIAQNGIWLQYKRLLMVKKNNVFIKNGENMTAYEMVAKTEQLMSTFTDLLVHSYYNTLLISKNDHIFEWEAECANKITSQKQCFELIKNNITNNSISIPSKKSAYCNVDIEKYDENIIFSTFIGVALDIVVGLYMLYDVNDKITTTLDNNDILFNEELDTYYKQTGIKKNANDFLNIEIVWLYQHIFMVHDLDQLITNFMSSEMRFLIIPIGIELTNGSHSNILIYDKKMNTMERFEPNGSNVPPNYNYNEVQLDKTLYNYFKRHFNSLKYLTPKHFLPKIGFQAYEQVEHYKTRKLGDPGGFCAAWCLWYAKQRLKYPDIPSDKLVHILIKQIKYNNFSFKNLIRHYAKQITDVRDNMLTQINMNINTYLNNQYDEKMLKSLAALLQR